METPDFFEPDLGEEEEFLPTRPGAAGPRPRPPLPLRRGGGIWGWGERIGWIAGLVLALSSFMGWYAGSSLEGPSYAVIGWHTGAIGKLVFFIGLAVLALAALREVGVELPPAVPESLAVVGLGALATVLVLVRVISIPDTYAGTAGRGIGLWISLLAALGVIGGGLLRAGEEL